VPVYAEYNSGVISGNKFKVKTKTFCLVYILCKNGPQMVVSRLTFLHNLGRHEISNLVQSYSLIHKLPIVQHLNHHLNHTYQQPQKGNLYSKFISPYVTNFPRGLNLLTTVV